MPRLLLLSFACVFALLGVTLTSCSSTKEQPANSDWTDIGVFEPMTSVETHRFQRLRTDAPFKLEVINLHGNVTIKEDEDIYWGTVTVVPIDGRGPGHLVMTVEDEVHRIWLLDTIDARNSDYPQAPVARYDGKMTRYNRRIPQVDIEVRVPRKSYIDVRACAGLDVYGTFGVTARCGGLATLHSGHGWLKGATRSLHVDMCSYNVAVDCSRRARFENAMGDKFVRGSGSVELLGGQGYVDIDVDGSIYSNCSISHGYTRTDSNYQPSNRAYDQPVGPLDPFEHDRAAVFEGQHTYNLLKGSEVDVRLSITQRLDVNVDVSDGTMKLGIPQNTTRVDKFVTDDRFELISFTESSASFRLNAPVGELRVKARDNAKVIVEK